MRDLGRVTMHDKRVVWLWSKRIGCRLPRHGWSEGCAQTGGERCGGDRAWKNWWRGGRDSQYFQRTDPRRNLPSVKTSKGAAVFVVEKKAFCFWRLEVIDSTRRCHQNRTHASVLALIGGICVSLICPKQRPPQTCSQPSLPDDYEFIGTFSLYNTFASHHLCSPVYCTRWWSWGMLVQVMDSVEAW